MGVINISKNIDNSNTIEIKLQHKQVCLIDAKEENYLMDIISNLILKNELNNTFIDLSKISILNISSCNLTSLPKCLGNLNLKVFNLSHNKFNEVPACLNDLSNLIDLDLSYNLIESFNQQPGCISSLQRLNISHNNFPNMPKWILTFRCISLQELNYSYNTAKHYNYLKNSYNLSISKLGKLVLINSCLIDTDFKLLRSLRMLEHLDISNSINIKQHCINKFEDLDSLFVKPKWNGIKVLALNYLSLSVLPEGIMWMETLTELYISKNNLSWIPSNIQYLVNLEVLDASQNELVVIPSQLFSLQSLKKLILSSNSIDRICDISDMVELQMLDLYDNCLTEFPYNIKTLKYIDLEFNYIDTNNCNLTDYNEKKNNLRSIFDKRFNGSKQFPIMLQEDSSEKEDFSSDVSDREEVSYVDDVDENWDDPLEYREKDPLISVSDNEWNGEYKKSKINKNNLQNRLYVDDEDWMFEDID